MKFQIKNGKTRATNYHFGGVNAATLVRACAFLSAMFSHAGQHETFRVYHA
jgi:hypothetical protein